MALTDKLTAIADAIRARTGSTSQLTLDQMPNAIGEIKNTQFYNFLNNQPFDVTADDFGSETSLDAAKFKDSSIASIEIPYGTRFRTIPAECFCGCGKLKTVKFLTWTDSLGDTYCEVKTIGTKAFYSTDLTSLNLPSSLTTIGDQAFYGSTLNIDLVIPANVTSIGDQAFCNTFVKTVTFETATPSSLTINPTAFSYCGNLTDIYVPWAAGAVANAPWGATSATIHYNSGV